jgi:prolyl-tRNA editing enzyme YbaK/EbsC (Cys-tRNA(Pro) deacylase)
MSITKAREYLKKYKLDKEILEFDVSSATVELAAKALSCNESDIAKSLSFYLEDKPIIIIVAGDKKIDNSKYKAEFHKKAKMIPFDEVEKVIGHAAGGVCPFGINAGIDVYLDESLKEHEYIYPACGSSNSAIKLKIKKLEEIVDNKKWIDVCK